MELKNHLKWAMVTAVGQPEGVVYPARPPLSIAMGGIIVSESSEKHRAEYLRYWRRNEALIAKLLAIWAVVSLFLGVIFIETLNKLTLFGLPLGFWIAQQGSIYVFVVLIFVYAWRMDKLDHTYHMDE
jgi:putative solute:sodium symporter small subunit